MMRSTLFVIAVLILVLSQLAPAHADNHLELGVLAASASIHDDAYEAFSSQNTTNWRIGVDLRYEVFALGDLHLVPFVGYRYGSDGGDIFETLDTSLGAHDLLGGLRARWQWLSFLSLYGDVFGGAQLSNIAATMSVPSSNFGDFESARRYTDSVWTWQAGARGGVEFYIPRAWFEKRGIKRFTFGGEIGAGYVWRGTTTIEPSLDSPDDQALPITEAGAWGDLNQSAVEVQLGLGVRFY